MGKTREIYLQCLLWAWLTILYSCVTGGAFRRLVLSCGAPRTWAPNPDEFREQRELVELFDLC